MLSILINHKNRAGFRHPRTGVVHPLFLRCFESLMLSLEEFEVKREVIILDWPSSSDEFGLPDHIKSDPRVTLREGVGSFTRGGGRNQLGNLAAGPVLFFLDSDMLMGPHVIERGLQVVSSGGCYFPNYMRIQASGKSFMGTGTGNSIVSRDVFLDYFGQGGFVESDKWGGEDSKFHHYCRNAHKVVRDLPDHFWHMWHPKAPGAIDERPKQ
jgi:hypothetical protein